MTNNNLKALSLPITILLMITAGFAQNIAPLSINSGGASLNQANGGLNFTVGDLVVINLSDSQGNTLGGGISAGATLTTVGIQESDIMVLNVNVFPNPSDDLINIRINHSSLDYIILCITDMNAKELYTGKFAGISNTIGINTSAFAAGTYLLSLKNIYNHTIGTYKIIKN